MAAVSGTVTRVLLKDLPQAPVSVDVKIRLVAMLMEELAVAEALTLIHGRDGGYRRYYEAGGHVRFDEDGEPYLDVEAG